MSKLRELKSSSPTPRAKERGTTPPTGGTVVPTGYGGTFLGTPVRRNPETPARDPREVTRGERERVHPDPPSTPGRRFFSGPVLEIEARVLKKADLESFFREILAQHLQPSPPQIQTRDDCENLNH